MKGAKSLGVTAAEVRASIAQAERDLLAETVKLGEALVIQQAAMPDRDVTPEQAAVDAARDRVEKLRLMLPFVEKAEAEALAETRSQLDGERQRQLARAMKDLLRQAMHFSAAYSNAASAFRRMVKAGADATLLLSDAQLKQGQGYFQVRLGGSGLHAACETEIARIGLLPAYAHGISAPAADHRKVDLNFTNAPHLLPALEDEVRRLTALLLPAPAEAQEKANAPLLPKVAEIAKEPPAASAEVSSRHPSQEDTP